MTNANIKTKGMHCRSCEMVLTDVLGETNGIKKVKVSYEKGIVSVDFDENKIKLSAIKSLIKKEGYDAG